MIQIIDKQIELLNYELDENPGNSNVIELLRILTLFKEVFNQVLNGQQQDGSALSQFICQLLTSNGDVDFVALVKDYMKLHKLSQNNIMDSTGLAQGRISEFLNHKHAMRSDNLSKVFKVVKV